MQAVGASVKLTLITLPMLPATENDKSALVVETKTAKGAARVAQILSVALDILASEGHANLTLEGVAKQIGIRKGNLQYYFPSRAHLLRGALAEQIKQNRGNWSRLYETKSSSPIAKLKQLIRYELEINGDTKFVAQVRERRALETRDETARALTNQWYEWVTEKYANLIAEMRPDLDDKNCHQLAIIIYSMLVGSAAFFGGQRAAPQWSKDVDQKIEQIIVKLIVDPHY